MSRTWLLAKADGDPNFVQGDVDLVWENGRPVTLDDPRQVLDQRVRKIVQQPLGTNLFVPDLGFGLKRLIGRKAFGDSQVKEIGASVLTMFNTMKSLQVETQARIKLEAAELIDSLNHIRVIQRQTQIDVEVIVVTQDQQQTTVSIPGVGV